LAVATVVAAVAVAGCGSAVRKPVVLDRATVSQLDHELAVARSGLAGHSRARARAALEAVSRLVETHAGEISSVDLRNLRVAIVRALARIPVDIVPVVASPPTPTQSIPAQPAPQPESKPKPPKPTPPKPKRPKPPKPTPPKPAKPK
jgi:outer membrane biosynthesis protein TonB